jgi:DnaJ-class molecular chaperone
LRLQVVCVCCDGTGLEQDWSGILQADPTICRECGGNGLIEMNVDDEPGRRAWWTYELPPCDG